MVPSEANLLFHPARLIPVPPPGILLLLLVSWYLISIISSALTGWRLLSRRFRALSSFSGPEWSWQSARMRYGIGYNNCLRVGADRVNLSLATMFFLRAGHPPLFISWQEISVRRRFKVFFSSFVELRLGREEQIPFSINAKLAEGLAVAAGENWPADPVS